MSTRIRTPSAAIRCVSSLIVRDETSTKCSLSAWIFRRKLLASSAAYECRRLTVRMPHVPGPTSAAAYASRPTAASPRHDRDFARAALHRLARLPRDGQAARAPAPVDTSRSHNRAARFERRDVTFPGGGRLVLRKTRSRGCNVLPDNPGSRPSATQVNGRLARLFRYLHAQAPRLLCAMA